MTVGTGGDKTLAFKRALRAAAETSMRPLALREHGLLVRTGRPTESEINNFDDIVGVTEAQNAIADGPMATNRGAETHEMLVTVTISVWRPGADSEWRDDADDLETQAETQAYALLRALEEYVRTTDRTLGGVVLLGCRCDSHRSDGESDRKVIARGREFQIDAVFRGKARIDGPRATT